MKKVLLAILSVVIVSSLNVWASTYQNGYRYKNIETKRDYAIYQVVKDSISTGYRDNRFGHHVNTNTQETVGTEIQIESGTLRYSINQETKEATVLGFKNDVSETTLVIPAKVVYEDVDYKVVRVGESSFSKTGIEEVIFPETLEEIGIEAFEYCQNLKEVMLPDNVESIGKCAFDYTAITSLVLPKHLKILNRICPSSLKSLYFGDKLHAYGPDRAARSFDAFYGTRSNIDLPCIISWYHNLEKIEVSENNEYFLSDSGLLYDKYGKVLKNAPANIKKPELLNNMNFISEGAFDGSKAEVLSLPESVWGIGFAAFVSADKMRKLYLSPNTRYFNSMRSVGGDFLSAFSGSSIKEIYLGSDIAYPIDEDLFPRDRDMILHVPANVVNNFKQTRGWNNINNIIGDMDFPETKVLDFDYCNGYVEYRIYKQVLGGPSRQSGILITKEELKPYIGMKIRSVQFCQHWGKDMYVFVEEGLSGKRLAFQRGTGNHGEWSSISFDTPYVITGDQDLMVGFGSETDGYGIEYSETEYSTRNWMRETGGNWVPDNDSPGAYKIICSIEGSKIPMDIRIREVAYDEMNDGNSVHVKGVLENLGPDVANVVELYCIVTPLSGDGQPFSSVIKLDNLAIGHKQREMFETDIDFSGYDQSVLQTYTRSGDVPYGKYRIELKVRTVNGLPDEYDNNDLSELYVEFVPKPKFKRRVVMEASLATWCGYSALGKEVISVLSKEMPDKFIGIAVHYNDVFTPVVGYGNFVGMTGSVPGSLVNRDMSVYPRIADIRKAVNKYVYSAVADVRSDAHFVDETSSIIDVNADVMLSKEAKNNYRIAYVLVEDKVGPEYQNSHYTLPEIGLDADGGKIYHDGIARSITEFDGLPETELTGNGREMEFKKTVRLEVPLSVSQKENLRLVAMLINQESGIIENAFSSSIAPYVKIPVKQIIISPENFVASEGDRVKLECKVIPENATIKDIEFHSTNPEVATVDNEGNVNVLSDGFCEIVVSAADGWGARSKCIINPVSSVSEIDIYGESEYPDVYNMQGILVCSKADPDMLGRLSKGIYVLRYSDKTVKMMR